MIAYKLNISTQSIPLAWVSELNLAKNMSSVTNHCPDHVIILDHKHRYSSTVLHICKVKVFRMIILHIFGTRMFPTPSPQDILMDLAGHTVPFLTGEAHAGLVWGTR